MGIIAVSCSGEGFGHIARMSALIQKLESAYQIHFFCPASIQSFVRENLPLQPVYPIPFLRFIKKQDKIDYLHSLWENLKIIASFPRHKRRIRNILKDRRVEAVLCDFEPLLPRCARRLGIPVLQLNHPSAVLGVCSVRPDAIIAKLVSLYMMGPFTKKILCSFYNGSVGPMLRRQISSLRPQKEQFLLIYLKGSYRKLVLKKLIKMGVENIRVFPDPAGNFPDSLASCSGIISNAGHQIICESVYLQKPLFVLPLRGQYEQRLNALMLERSGWGIKGSIANIERELKQFLERLDFFPLPVKARPNCRFDFSDCTDKAVSEINGCLRRWRLTKQCRLIRSALPAVR